jgi:hypothetical protein
VVAVDKVDLLPYYPTNRVDEVSAQSESSTEVSPVATQVTPVAPGHSVSKKNAVMEAIRAIGGLKMAKTEEVADWIKQRYQIPDDQKTRQYISNIKTQMRKAEKVLEAETDDRDLEEKLASLPYGAFRPIRNLVNEHGKELVLAMIQEMFPDEDDDEDENNK